ncbi:growth hormone secretagogue receptor type 1-like isoform X2 [Symsagittifera roscoffensis]|uniref:growth hormone secretagogue receptor type 1-like isoform X2 n=1 Tax=Symsagittifera roscoffensis TaxID=84072 RepID=UPI00307B9519
MASPVTQKWGTAVLIIYTCAIIVIGGIGNGVLIFVHFRRRPDPRSTSKIKVLYHFIFIMAVLDLISCTLILPTHVYQLVFECQYFSIVACKLFAYGRLFCVYSSMFILVAIAIDRYISVCFPFVESATINMKKARVLTALALVAGGLAAVPNLVVFEVTELTSGVTTCQPTRSSAIQRFLTEGLLYMTLSLYVCCAVVIIFLYTSVFVSVFRQAIKRRNLRNRSAIQNTNALGATVQAVRDHVTARTGMMLFLVTTVFILAWTPYWTMYLLMYNFPATIPILVEKHVMNLFGSSYYINNAVNPIIYTFVNKTFRDEIVSILKCQPQRGQGGSLVSQKTGQNGELNGRGSRIAKTINTANDTLC